MQGPIDYTVQMPNIPELYARGQQQTQQLQAGERRAEMDAVEMRGLQMQAGALEDKDKWTKAYSDVAPYMTIPYAQRNEMIMNTAIESQDPERIQAAQNFISLPEEKQVDAFSVMHSRGTIRGWQPKPVKAAASKGVYDLVDKKETFATNAQIQADPARYRPIEKKGTTVNVGKGETKFAEAEGTASSKEITEYGKTITTAKKTIQNVSNIESLFKKIPKGSLLTGTGAAPIVGKISKYAEAAGFDVEGLDASEMIDMLAKKAAKESKVPGSGTYTDADFQIDLKLQPGIEGTNKGNALKIKYMKANAKYEMAYAKEARSYISKNKSRTGLDEHMAAYEAKRPYKETLQKAIFGKTIESSAMQLAPADQEAFNWANSNPNDPRAQAILQKLGVQ